MNMSKDDAMSFLPHLLNNLASVKIASNSLSKLHISIAPPMIYISELINQLHNFNINVEQKALLTKIHITAQNVSSYKNGAFTGEVSTSMLRDYNDDIKLSILIGHSERRTLFNETNELLLNKLTLCLDAGLVPILCFGETKKERDNLTFLSKIQLQLEATIAKISNKKISKLILAYEPVWAIGTGQNASVEQIEEVHNYVRSLLIKYFGQNKALNIPILYGGSCSNSNARSILTIHNVDGVLIGGASLNPTKFAKIIKIANELS